MTNGDMERRVEFFAKQQESFADNIQQIAYTLKDVAERQNKFQEEIDNLKSRQDQFQSQIDLTSQATMGLISVVGLLTESQKRTDDQLKELGGRLDMFINVVERYINESRNGKHRNSM
jgi:chromosome segregation ATPase